LSHPDDDDGARNFKGQSMNIAGIAVAVAALLLPAGISRTASPSVIQRIPGSDGGWDLLSVDSANHQLLVARSDGVMAVDLSSGHVTPRFVPGERLHDVFAIPGSRLGLATAGQAKHAILFKAATGVVEAEIGTGANPDAAIFDPTTKTVWVMNAADGTATVIDPDRAKVVATVMIGGGLELPAIDGHGHLFVNVEDKNEIAELDIAARKVIRHIALRGCDGPTGLVYIPSGVLISACANGVAKLVRASTGQLIGDIVIGPRPDGAFADTKRHRAYIPSGGDGSLTVIDTSSAMPRAIAKIATQLGARTGAVDPATGKVYLPAARFEPAVAGQRPKMIPGSFEILVVGG
jgi:DNA-binding beta-propeller fold protein YncE